MSETMRKLKIEEKDWERRREWWCWWGWYRVFKSKATRPMYGIIYLLK